ncbi:unnamed protein product [Schistocephalus solidus]|uniref:Small ribosomal subunit protein mS31 n=1 Tax=Schistocephalus solidus TaxID=70667 RepID=A0A183SCX5_SCHSO|nr:unnamed protein product [Schistocephalus solidus]
MTALLTGSVRRQSLFLQFSKICKARLLSSDKKSRPPRSKPQSFEERRKLQKAASKPAGSIPTSLPQPEQLNIFDELPFPGNEPPPEESGEFVYNNTVFDEVEALEASTYRSKNIANKFEELMQWTLDGKLWRYPIDNEQDWDTEHETGFEDHVFLNRFLDRTSKKPAPLAAFMELVCTGLAQNPYLDSNEKRKHLEWFEGYFKNKAGQIEAAVLEEKRLAELEAKAKATTQ